MQENAVNQLTLELLSWIASQPRTYAQAMEAWRSNCPRHPVWEDALAAGLIEVQSGRISGMKQAEVTLTQRGRALLAGSPPQGFGSAGQVGGANHQR